ncbi:MAG TPA: glutamine--fructose-6-phosphate transaminase (isomerizing) [Candidatus Krumholzibacteria bacterium]|nr:glutamine--fructose-6-phosphate transaminase (isomerizing) [Candidatus Krumholzibacteria bacterium]
MCGIIAYIGDKPALPILMEGLKRLEYRGYDSAGVALVDGKLRIEKCVGRIAQLEEHVAPLVLPGSLGMAHTRWATHGEPTTINAHPHTDCTGKLAVIHNGIIENFESLKRNLLHRGHTFKSETDTEVLAHLIEEFYDGRLDEAVRAALGRVEGTFGIAVLHADEPRRIVGARNGSPLIVGIGDGEYFLASDASAILRHTRQVIYLEDQEMVALGDEAPLFTSVEDGAEEIAKEATEIEWDLAMIEKGGYSHFMLKEIFEQPSTIRNAFRGRLLVEEGDAKLGGLNMTREELREVKRVVLIGCGTSWHAALLGEYMIEEVARIGVEVEYASEFRYRNPIVEEGTITFVISQSGETIDTLAAMREAKRKGARTLGIVNVVGSTIARESDGGVYIHAGPEIGVASTKAFTSQATVLAIITLLLGRLRNMSRQEGRRLIAALEELPGQIEQILAQDAAIEEIARVYQHHDNFLYLGRGPNFPVALEGALKLKEISYVHAEGYPAAEMKHGPIALIDENMPVVVIATRDSGYRKIVGNVEEVKARKGRIIAVVTEGDTDIVKKADHTLIVPETLSLLTPILSVVPLQLLAYHIAVMRGCDVDRPRNLAKSVTVE